MHLLSYKTVPCSIAASAYNCMMFMQLKMLASMKSTSLKILQIIILLSCTSYTLTLHEPFSALTMKNGEKRSGTPVYII